MNVELKPISKEEFISKLHEIERIGWIENTTRLTNDGAIGNKLEDLLGIPENNLPIPNAAEWELKTQRDDTMSLLTLFHMEPSPRALEIVSSVLLKKYGWLHKDAGKSYPPDEMSFRATLSAKGYTHGFSIRVDRDERKVSLVFDLSQVKRQDYDWSDTIRRRVANVEKLEIVPYWGFDDLFSKARGKLLNCFFVIAETKNEDGKQYIHYYKAYMLKNLLMEKFIWAIENGEIYVDFDARTGPNHGTKFRINPPMIPALYEVSEIVLDAPKLAKN